MGRKEKSSFGGGRTPTVARVGLNRKGILQQGASKEKNFLVQCPRMQPIRRRKVEKEMHWDKALKGGRIMQKPQLKLPLEQAMRTHAAQSGYTTCSGGMQPWP